MWRISCVLPSPGLSPIMYSRCRNRERCESLVDSFLRRRSSVAIITMLVAMPPVMAWLHHVYPRTPVWMPVGPAFVVAVLLFATVANRLARKPRGPGFSPEGLYGPDGRPGWLGWLDRIVGTAIVVWFAPDLYDSWQHTYPATPSWMSFITAIILIVVLTSIPFDILAAWFAHLRRRRDARDLGQPTALR